MGRVFRILIVLLSMLVYIQAVKANSRTARQTQDTCGRYSDNSTDPAETLKIVCHIGLWTLGDHFGSYTGDVVDPFLCTHYVVNYFTVENSQGKWFPRPPSDDEQVVMDKVFQLKKINPNLKMLIAIGGYTDNRDDITKYFKLVSNEANANEFAQNTVKYLNNNQLLDGIDFQWNYPGRHPGSSGNRDREALAKFTQIMCSTLKSLGYICMITLQRPDHRMENETRTYDAFRKIIKEADMVNIWTSDIPPEPTAFIDFLHTDLLYRPPPGTYMEDIVGKYTVQTLIEMFTNQVLDSNDISSRSKLLMTIPMQGNSCSMMKYNATWTASWPTTITSQRFIPEPPKLAEKTNTGYETGLEQIPFFKVCRQVRLLPMNDPLKLFLYSHYTQDNVKSTPVAYNKDRFIPANTPDSVRDKVKYAARMQLGGVSVFQITADDVKGWCYNQTYPLLNAIFDEVQALNLKHNKI